MLLLAIVAVVLVAYLTIRTFGKIAKRDKHSLISVRSASSAEEESASHQTR
jgi:hypothetical protein